MSFALVQNVFLFTTDSTRVSDEKEVIVWYVVVVMFLSMR